MKGAFLWLIAFSIFLLGATDLPANFACGKDLKDVNGIDECLSQNLYDALNSTNNAYCCMLDVSIGATKVSKCVPVNSTNYEYLKSKDFKFNLIENKFKYDLYCNKTNSSKMYLQKIFSLLSLLIFLIF